jgi:hypothetical protein
MEVKPRLKLVLRKSTSKEEIVEFAHLALKGKLFVPRWTLKSILERVLKFPQETHCIVLAFNGDSKLPIGICHMSDWFSVSFFVKENYRCRGIAQSMGALMLVNHDSHWNHGYGNAASHHFFPKLRNKFSVNGPDEAWKPQGVAA